MEEGQPTLSTSAETIRNLPALRIPAQSSSSSPARSHSHSHSRSRSRRRSSSRPHLDSPSSPHSPWSPSSPSGESVSSLPSVGSSFLFSSVPASPPHHPSHYPGELRSDLGHNDFGEGDRSLIIPSLTLPSPLRPPTSHGHALGRMRLLVIGNSTADSLRAADEVVSLLTDQHCPELVHVGPWEDWAVDGEEVVAQVIRMSSDWTEHSQVHGDDRYEPCGNIELVRLREYDPFQQNNAALHTALSIIQASFHTISRVHDINALQELLNASTSTLSSPSSRYHLSTSLISSLLYPSSSGNNLLFTAAIVVPSAPSSPTDESLIVELRKHIPVIVLTPSDGPEEEDTPKPDSHTPPSPGYTSLRLSNARPPLSPSDLRAILYQNTHALASLRREAAELFLRWAGLSQQSIVELLEIPLKDKSYDTSPQLFDPQDVDARFLVNIQEQVQAEDRLEGTVKARTSASQHDRPKTRRASMTKSTHDRGISGGSNTLRGRPTRGQTMERRKTITAATHARPIVGPLARLDSLAQSRSSAHPSPPTQSRRRRYAVEHGLATTPGSRSSAHGHGHTGSIPPSSFSTFDPLHIPSLVRLAVEGLLLGPLRLRLTRLFGGSGGFVREGSQEKEDGDGSTGDRDVQTRSGTRMSSFVPIALIAGAFCAGVGVGIVFARSGI